MEEVFRNIYKLEDVEILLALDDNENKIVIPEDVKIIFWINNSMFTWDGESCFEMGTGDNGKLSFSKVDGFGNSIWKYVDSLTIEKGDNGEFKTKIHNKSNDDLQNLKILELAKIDWSSSISSI